jgi:uncharacterized protein with LGFP repeats
MRCGMWQMRWKAINAEVIYAPDNAIAQFWRQHPELGSPLSGEIGLDEGGVAQAFANGIVRWSPETGAELVSG